MAPSDQTKLHDIVENLRRQHMLLGEIHNEEQTQPEEKQKIRNGFFKLAATLQELDPSWLTR